MEIKEYSMEQLNKLLEEMKKTIEKSQEDIEYYQNYIASREEQIKVAQSMIEERQEIVEKAREQFQKITEERTKQQNYATRLFPVEDVYLMCFRQKKGAPCQDQQSYMKGLVPYLSGYKKVLAEFQKKEEDGKMVQVPVYKDIQTFSKNPDDIQYAMEECILDSQNIMCSTLFPGVPIKDIISSMKEENLSVQTEDSLIGYEEIKKIAQYAYKNWSEKNSWNTGKEEFFESKAKVKKMQI